MSTLVLALAKGRLLPPALELLQRAGWEVPGPELTDGRLICRAEGPYPLTLVVARPDDVPTYVEYGAAHLGVVGKDVLRERECSVCELLDLGVGWCRLALAFPADRRVGLWPPRLPLRIATSYPRQVGAFLQARRVPGRVVVVRGAAELAPLVGLADGIVDVVATGRTLAQHGLEIAEVLSTSTARLVAYPVSLRMGGSELGVVVGALRRVVEHGEAS